MKKRDYARTFGQDLMRKEHIVDKHKAMPGGADGKNSAYLHKTAGGKYEAVKKTTSAEGVMSMPETTRDPQFYVKKREIEKQLGRELSLDDFLTNHYTQLETAISSGTSIFDPVLVEVACRWFCPPSGVILDPFAGGSVRGVVASKLGFKYNGIDLSARQIEANRKQGVQICDVDNQPNWVNGNSLDCETLLPGLRADFVFSCPPYADLEVYSDDPNDLSNMPYDKFVDMYSKIIAAACRMLKQDRFACFVIGDVRDKDGFYRNFPAHTTQAFEDAGARFYNEAILITAVGSLPVRMTKQFNSARKMGKTHQNVYVYCKGDPKRATQAIGVDIDA